MIKHYINQCPITTNSSHQSFLNFQVKHQGEHVLLDRLRHASIKPFMKKALVKPFRF